MMMMVIAHVGWWLDGGSAHIHLLQ